MGVQMNSIRPISSVARAYDLRDFDLGPATYRDNALLHVILEGTELQPNQGKLIVDLMAGSGKVGQAIEKTYPGNQLVYVDFSQSQLDKIDTPTGRVILADVRNGLPFPADWLDVVVVRYGIKDLAQHQQRTVLNHIALALQPAGRLVVTDMFAPTRAQAWLNRQHSLKQQLGGRNITADGECYIPTLREWRILLHDAGFAIRSLRSSVSSVSTLDWYLGKQFSGTADEQQAALRRINDFMRNAPRSVVRAFRMRYGDTIQIAYPVIVIAADKSTGSGSRSGFL